MLSQDTTLARMTRKLFVQKGMRAQVVNTQKNIARVVHIHKQVDGVFCVQCEAGYKCPGGNEKNFCDPD